MSVVDVILIVAIVVVVVIAVRRFAGTASGKRDCCSGDVKDGQTARKGVNFPEAHIEDTNESHYPHTAIMEIGGMSCENCVARVTNALDSIPGTWALVELQGGSALVRSKSEIDEAALRDVVDQAGYRTLSVRVTA